MLQAPPSARVLSALQSADLARAAVILIRGGIVALPFNGIFALFGDLELDPLSRSFFGQSVTCIARRL